MPAFSLADDEVDSSRYETLPVHPQQTMKLRVPRGRSRIQSVLILGVFLAFVTNAIGLTSFQFALGQGISVNAQMAGNLLSGQFPGPLLRVDFSSFLIVGAFLAALLPTLSPIAASLLTLVAMAPPFYIAWAFPVPPPIVPLEYSLLCILVLFSVNVLCSYFIETHQRQKIVAVFDQYVPPAVVAEIARSPQEFSMAGEARDITVLFCDIKDFSAISEQLEPHELASMLNYFLTEMTSVLHRHGATIDKYIGDAIMAFWGTPVPQPDHADRAVTGALAMQEAMHEVRVEFHKRGWPEIDIEIGINSGIVNVGNMGSHYRVAYTVVGDAVNVAARLEALTHLYGVNLLISESTRDARQRGAYLEIDHVRVKGKDRSTRIFEPLLEKEGGDEPIRRHHEGLEAYYSGSWREAQTTFDALRELKPAYYEMMMARMAANMPPPQWRGVVIFSGDLSYAMESGAGE